MSHKRALVLLRYRLWFTAVFQGCLVVCSLMAAWLLRFDFTLPYRGVLFAALPVLLLTRLLAVAFFGLLRGWWRFAGMRDGTDILKAVATASVAFWITIRFVLHMTSFPRTIYVLEAVLTTGMLIGVRLLSRVFAESVQRGISPSKRVILIGAGSAAQAILRELRRPGSEYEAVGCLDDNQ